MHELPYLKSCNSSVCSLSVYVVRFVGNIWQAWPLHSFTQDRKNLWCFWYGAKMVWLVGYTQGKISLTESVVTLDGLYYPSLFRSSMGSHRDQCLVPFYLLYTQPVSQVMHMNECVFHKFPCDLRLLTTRLEYCIKEVNRWLHAINWNWMMAT